MGAAVLQLRWFSGWKHQKETWSPDVLLPGETWLLLLMKVVGALVVYTGPTIVSVGRALAGAAVAALAVVTGAAIANALRAAANPIRLIREGFMSILPFMVSGVLVAYDPLTAVDGSASRHS
jgi:hypothetical protein